VQLQNHSEGKSFPCYPPPYPIGETWEVQYTDVVLQSMIAARFWAGVASSTFSTMIGGVITDMYQTHERDGPMAMFVGAAIFGIGFGSLIAGFIARYTTWRWTFWLQAIVNGLLVSLFALCIGETRSSIILQQKADILNKWEADLEGRSISLCHDAQRRPRISWTTSSQDENFSFWKSIANSTVRPFQLLLTEPVVTAFSLWAGFSWAVLYICLSVIPLVFEDVYAFEPQEATTVFTASCVGTILATFVGAYQEPIAKRYGLLPSTPEARLYCCCVESWLLPIGVSHPYPQQTN
jgi:MFS family permease